MTQDLGIQKKALSECLGVQVTITGTNLGTHSIFGGQVFIVAAKLTLQSQLKGKRQALQKFWNHNDVSKIPFITEPQGRELIFLLMH